MTLLADAGAADLAAHRMAANSDTAVRIWLFALAGFVFAMVVAGGATRLTGSGLSITEWQPILGTIPPLSAAAWLDAFVKYRHIPQFQPVNPDMSLEGFKAIYWWEWTHRLLGRLTGIVFLLPFLYFLGRRAIPKTIISRVIALFILGSAQGTLGWFMVKSGLSDRVDVSQYRLAAHLALATAIAGYAFWLGLSTGAAPPKTAGAKASPHARAPRWGAIALAAAVYLQIVAGAFVAGLKGGLASNTWPLMNGEIFPAGLDAYTPWFCNLFENPLTAQFVHRALAYFVAILIAAFGVAVWNRHRLRLPIAAAGAAVLAQIALGVATILYGVPLAIALAHQANAMLVFALSLWTVRRAALL